MNPRRDDADSPWQVPSAAERRRAQRRDYHQRRIDKAPAADGPRQRWTIAEARVALDTTLPVLDAAKALGRSANAVESLRRRWRTGRLPAVLADQVPPPPGPKPTATDTPGRE
ncbi:MAG: hypothetical protein AB7G47_19405 [Mycolicibacterium sp.]|uniref:hypothetical protein n=1 Tax=Mycolicibacterium sp. TaxID=2320850 RepID=UPI003D14B3E3